MAIDLNVDHVFAIPVAVVSALFWNMASALESIPLSPILTGGLLFALTGAPNQFRTPLISRLREYLSPSAIGTTVTTLKWLFVLGLGRNVSNALSVLAQNNMRLRSEKSKYDWPREIAVVTGAAGGFGSLISKDLASKGITVVAVDVVDGSPSSLKVDHGRIHYYKCDITSREAVEELAERVRKEHGDPSILVNNAGVAFTHSLTQASEKAIRLLYDVNIISHYHTLHAFLPSMVEKKKGHIVSMASMSSFQGVVGIGAYSQTKAAVLSLHETLTQELRQIYGAPEVLCSVIHPTFASTAMTSGFDEEMTKGKVKMIEPQDVSDAVVGQIMNGRGGQICLYGNLPSIISVMRGLPHWMTYALLRSGEGRIKKQSPGPERRSGLMPTKQDL